MFLDRKRGGLRDTLDSALHSLIPADPATFTATLTFYTLTQSVKLLHGAKLALLALGPRRLLQGGHGECLLQSQHNLVHLYDTKA